MKTYKAEFAFTLLIDAKHEIEAQQVANKLADRLGTITSKNGYMWAVDLKDVVEVTEEDLSS
jgi:hypothetical protein